MAKLNNVEILRPFIVVLIVINHSFAIYSGIWPSPFSAPPHILAYKWIQRLSIFCTLELFTFISGYLFANKECRSFQTLVEKKFCRLIIPCLVFGTIYYFINTPYDDISIFGFLYSTNNGFGHLWFLPMLFWCFVFAYFIRMIDKKLNSLVVLLAIWIVSRISVKYVPDCIGLQNACAYFVYFYLGIVCRDKKLFMVDNEKNSNKSSCHIIITSALSVSYFLLIYVSGLSLFDGFIKAIVLFSIRTFGIFLFMFVATDLSNRMSIVPKWILQASRKSFGVYIFHQIIIDFLYYKTSWPDTFGAYLLPIVVFPVSLIVSYLLTSFMLRYRIGQVALGEYK